MITTAITSASANDHSRSDRSSEESKSATARALAIVASILARLRTIPVSPISRCTSASVKRATFSMSNPEKALRKFSRLRRIVNHDRPLWKASRLIRSNSATGPRNGRPHSAS